MSLWQRVKAMFFGSRSAAENGRREVRKAVHDHRNVAQQVMAQVRRDEKVSRNSLAVAHEAIRKLEQINRRQDDHEAQ